MCPSGPGGRARSDRSGSPRERIPRNSQYAVPTQLLSRARLVRQRFSHVACASLGRLRLRQHAAFGVCEVRRLAEYQELVEGVYTEPTDQFQPHGETNAAEVIHCLVEG